jgi:hypothetical protein
LLLTTGEQSGAPPTEGPELGEPTLGSSLVAGQSKVLSHGQARHDVSVLADVAEPGSRSLVGCGPAASTEEHDLTVGGPDMTGDGSEDGALAGTVRAEQADQLTAGDDEVDRPHDWRPAVSGAHGSELKH